MPDVPTQTTLAGNRIETVLTDHRRLNQAKCQRMIAKKQCANHRMVDQVGKRACDSAGLTHQHYQMTQGLHGFEDLPTDTDPLGLPNVRWTLSDDVFGPLKDDRPPPIACFAPERTIYATSLSKSVAPGLRIGFLHAPDALADAVAFCIARVS